MYHLINGKRWGRGERRAAARGVARRLLSQGRGALPAMLTFTITPFWSRKVRLAVLTLATFIALC
jgi:hypothetical protein